MTAVNAGGISPDAITTTRPAAPASLIAVAGNAQVQLTWFPSIGATAYDIKRGTASGSETSTVATGVTATNHTDVNLANGTTYFYVVTAIGTAANSGNSPEASATPTAPPPPVISGTATAGGGFILNGSGGTDGGTYCVLTTTNLALPLSQWTRVATNHFDTHGNFVITNSINPDRTETFYRLDAR